MNKHTILRISLTDKSTIIITFTYVFNNGEDRCKDVCIVITILVL